MTFLPEGERFTLDDVEVYEQDTLYQGFFKMDKVTFRHRLFEGGWGPAVSREIFRRGHAVAAVVYDPQRQLIAMVEQFRIGALGSDTRQSPWLYEVVAGITEPGESPEAVIHRELQEEANIRAAQLIKICDYYSSPGGTDETLTLFCALADLSHAGGIHGLPHEGENIRVHVWPQQNVFDELYGGHFNNAATLICLQWLLINHAQLTEANAKE